MTDNEIIKALEHCGSKHTDNYGKYSCLKCPLFAFNQGDCSDELHDFALDLINRQKAEIESLKDIIVKSNRDMFSSAAIMIEENRERICFEKIRYLEGEIVRLQSMNQAKLDTIHDLSTRLETAKTEAIKEFADKLKICLYNTPSLFTQQRYIVKSEVDTLAEEMTEDEGK